MTRSSSPSAFETWVGDGTWHLVATVALTFAAQLAVLSQRDVVILEWRPADLAAIALNYYRNGFDFLHPQMPGAFPARHHTPRSWRVQSAPPNVREVMECGE